MLAATGSGSLRLTEDERGLRVEADLIPSEIGKHVALLVDREASAMSMSFGFTVPKDGQVWNADRTERTLTKVHLFEVSILSGQDPAYPATAGLGEVRALAERAGVDATQLSLALSSLSFGNFLDDEDVAIIDAAVRTLAPKKRGSAPASVLKALAEAKSRSNR
jgi:HK97 family phage prohead protease